MNTFRELIEGAAVPEGTEVTVVMVERPGDNDKKDASFISFYDEKVLKAGSVSVISADNKEYQDEYKVRANGNATKNTFGRAKAVVFRKLSDAEKKAIVKDIDKLITGPITDDIPWQIEVKYLNGIVAKLNK